MHCHLPEVVAHRGASADAPEHSHAAYDLAVAQGADVLELDVRATADRELVVVHDPTLARTAGDPRRVEHLTRGDVAALPPSIRPLTLDEVLDRHGSAARLLVELKDPRPEWEGLVPEAVERHGLANRVVVQSFDTAGLRRLRLRSPHLSLASLHERPPPRRALGRLARFVGAIGVRHTEVDAGLVGAAHARGLGVRAWTVNCPLEMDRLLHLGVDGLITDVPEVALAAKVPAAGLAAA